MFVEDKSTAKKKSFDLVGDNVCTYSGVDDLYKLGKTKKYRAYISTI